MPHVSFLFWLTFCSVSLKTILVSLKYKCILFYLQYNVSLAVHVHWDRVRWPTSVFSSFSTGADGRAEKVVRVPTCWEALCKWNANNLDSRQSVWGSGSVVFHKYFKIFVDIVLKSHWYIIIYYTVYFIYMHVHFGWVNKCVLNWHCMNTSVI